MKQRRNTTNNTNYKGKFHNGKRSFFREKKISRFWDVRLWLPVFIIILMVSLNIKGNKISAEYELQLEELRVSIEESKVKQERIAIVEEEPVPETTISQEDSDITALAVLADTVGHGKSDDVKRAIMWVAINRSEDTKNGYGLSLQEEIARPKQWQQYDPDGVYLADTYCIAESVYYAWKNNGARPMYNDMLWFAFNNDGSITVRNVYSGEKNRSEQTFGGIS